MSATPINEQLARSIDGSAWVKMDTRFDSERNRQRRNDSLIYAERILDRFDVVRKGKFGIAELIRSHVPEQRHREAYCICGAPLGEWAASWPEHIESLALKSHEI